MDLTCEPVYKIKSVNINVKDAKSVEKYMHIYPFEPKLLKKKYEDLDYRSFIYEEWIPKYLLNEK